jgi:hypothetical protein
MFASPRLSNSVLTSRRMTEMPRELSHCAILSPYARADNGGVNHFLAGRRLRSALLVFVGQEKFRIRLRVDSVSPNSTMASSSRCKDSSIELVRL